MFYKFNVILLVLRKANRDLALAIVRGGHCFADGLLDSFGKYYVICLQIFIDDISFYIQVSIISWV